MRYTLFDPKLGKGQFGTVWRAKSEDGTIVAVKRINREHKETENEVFILKKLNHKGIVQYLDSFEDAKSKDLCIVMEFCQGGTLTEHLKKSTRKPEYEVWRFSAHMTSALAYLHSQHPPIIHRDLKPDNILFQTTDTGKQPKIADFGIAKLLHKNQNIDLVYYTHNGFGDVYYMAPEALRAGMGKGDRVGISADMWSFGAILSAYCNKGKDLFTKQEDVLKWPGGDSTLDENLYSLSLREMTENLLDPNANKRKSAKQVQTEASSEKQEKPS